MSTHVAWRLGLLSKAAHGWTYSPHRQQRHAGGKTRAATCPTLRPRICSFDRTESCALSDIDIVLCEVIQSDSIDTGNINTTRNLIILLSK
jgi:hypothetical protein